MLPYVEFYFQFCCCCYYYSVLNIPILFCCALSYLSKRKKRKIFWNTHIESLCVIYFFFQNSSERIGWSMRNNKCLNKKKSSFPYSGFCRLFFFSSFFSFLNSLLFISVINAFFFVLFVEFSVFLIMFGFSITHTQRKHLHMHMYLLEFIFFARTWWLLVVTFFSTFFFHETTMYRRFLV